MLITIGRTYFHLFEIPILLILFIGVLHEFYSSGFSFRINDNKYISVFFPSMFLFTIAIFTSMLFAQESNLVLKDGIKWIEIDIIIIGLFLFLTNCRRFRIFYWILFFACFLFLVEIGVRYFTGILVIKSYRLIPGYESAFAFALVLPFIGEKSKYFLIVAFLCFGSALFSLSRGAWLASGFVSLYTFCFLNKNSKKLFIVLALLLLIISFSTEPLRSFIFTKSSTIFATEDASNVERTSLIILAWEAFSSSPIFGIGALNLFGYMQRIGFNGIAVGELEVVSVHNTFLQIAAEEGLFGLIAFVLMVGSIFAILLSRKRKLMNISPYLIGLTNFYIVMIVNFVFGYIASQFRFFIALLFGLILALVRISIMDKNYATK